LKQLRFAPFDRSDHSVESDRGVENTDARAASGAPGAAPPNYVKPEGKRPQH
jgi:hypothetical protein